MTAIKREELYMGIRNFWAKEVLHVPNWDDLELGYIQID
jgi:hypothetical protein